MAGQHPEDPVARDDVFQGVSVAQHEALDGPRRCGETAAMMQHDERSPGTRGLELLVQPGKLGRADFAGLFARYRRIEDNDLHPVNDLAVAVGAAIDLASLSQ